MPQTRKKKTKKQPQKWHHKARVRVTLVGATVKQMSAPHAKRAKHWWQRRSFWQKFGVSFVAVTVSFVALNYGVSYWYLKKHADEPLSIGVTFIPSYARHYDLDPQATMQAIIDDLGVKRFRLVSYWDIHEPEKGKYDFSELDWQFKKAEEAGAKVSLAIGLRQPRWPECHMPEWAEKMPKEQWSQELKEYMKVVMERYKDSPALESWQLENEFFMKVFGICPDHSKERLIDEYNFVKQVDSEHPVIITRSNNWIGIPIGQPRPDQFGISVYKRVWDKAFTKRYFEYPFPPWFYGMLAGWGEIFTGRSMIIHELQAEPWAPEGFGGVKNLSIEEQEKSMNPKRLKDRIQYGVDSGMRTMDLWGVEWWYWRKTKFNDPSIWEAGKQKIEEVTTADTQCNDGYYAKPIDGNRATSPC